MPRRLLVILLTAAATPAWAADLRDYCPDRPGLNTPACITDKGHLSVETGLVDWTRERDEEEVRDVTLLGDVLLRYGLGDRLEAQIGFSPIGLVRTRDRADGAIRHQSRAGDMLVGFKANLIHPDETGFAMAILPSATLPIGRDPVGAGDWGAGMRVPLSFKLSERVSLNATPEVDAEVNEAGKGRHLRYGTVAGIAFELAKSVHLGAGAEVVRDRDPEGHATMARASTSISWQPGKNIQFDTGVVHGLTSASPRNEAYVGVSRRF